MKRTQIYLTEEQQNELRTIADLRGATQSEVIREAIDHYVATYREANRVQLLRAARGIWSDREDLDLRELREELDRELAS